MSDGVVGSWRRVRAAWLGAAVWLLSGCFPEMPTLEPLGSEPDSGLPSLDGMRPDGPRSDGALPDGMSADDGGSVDTDPGSMGEACDGADDDDDGRVDEGFEGLDDPCAAGVGACRVEGRMRCTADRERVACDAMASDPSSELCNDIDDDCDGEVDEDFAGLGDLCAAGVGGCRVEGRMRCAANQQAVACDAVASGPLPEQCNGIDDDCNGQIDEDFDSVGLACRSGVGMCQAMGTMRCSADGEAVECDTPPLDVAELERCNLLDDDCDGEVDEGLIRGCEVEGAPRVCRPGTSQCVDGNWTPCVEVVAPRSRQDLCNGVDDDCDGRLDEAVLPGTIDGVGPVCDCADGIFPCRRPPVEGCEPARGFAEQCDPDDDIATDCLPVPELRCDGEDENCDGVVDGNAVCNADLARGCAVWFGWTTRGLPAPSDDWGDCADIGGIGDDISCNWTRGADAFVPIALVEGADVDDDGDRLGMSIRCGADPAGAYVTNHCRVFLGVGAADVAPGDGAAAWGPCPAMSAGGGEGLACAGSAPGGGFNPMPVPFDLTADTLVAVAFVCEDPADPARAAAMQAAVEVSLAWVDGQLGAAEPDLPAVCLPGGDGDPYSACATTRGDGRFRAMRLTADVDAGDRFAIRIRPVRR